MSVRTMKVKLSKKALKRVRDCRNQQLLRAFHRAVIPLDVSPCRVAVSPNTFQELFAPGGIGVQYLCLREGKITNAVKGVEIVCSEGMIDGIFLPDTEKPPG